MMKQVIFSSFIVLLLGNTVQAQQSATDPAVIAKAKVLAKEVFKDCPVYYGDNYIPMHAASLARIEIGTEAVQPGENYPLFSTVNLVANKCNPALSRDLTFDPATFNPLKYRFDYSSPVVKKYRVDNTIYIISVMPKQ